MIGNESKMVESTAWTTAADDLTGAADHGGTFRPGQTVTLIGVAADITTATVSNANIVVKMDKRPGKGSDTDRGDGDCGVITIPTGIAATKVVYKALSPPVDLNPGEEVVPQVTTAAAGGGAAGGCHYQFHYVPRSEKMGNCSNVVLSA